MFEQEIRWRLAARGDYPTDKLDASKSQVVRAEGQAELLTIIESKLTEDERAIVARGRNAALPSSAKGRKNTKIYRQATGFEALIAYWHLQAPPHRDRFIELLDAPIEQAIDAALEHELRRPKRG